MNPIKVNDVIRYRYDYAWEYGIVTALTPEGNVFTRIIKTKPPEGTTHVFQGVWKGEEFIPKKLVKIRKQVDVLDQLCDFMDKNKLRFVFWVCPDGCRGGVTWNADKTSAKCDVCGRQG